MPDASTATDIAAESTISWSDAAGWAYKAANLAFQIWNAKRNADQRQADRDMIGRYHDETMQQLFKMEAKDDFKAAQERADTYIGAIETNFDHLNAVGENADGDHSSDAYLTAMATFAANSVVDGKTPEDHIDGLYKELIGDVAPGSPKLIDSFCQFCTYADLSSSETFVGAKYLEWCMTRYRMALSNWALYHQLETVFPDKIPQHLEKSDFVDIDWSDALSADELKRLTDDKYSDQITKIIDTNLPIIAKLTSERFCPKPPVRSNSDEFFGWHTVKGKDEAEHFEKLRVTVGMGWLRAPEGNVIVGVRLCKGVKISDDLPVDLPNRTLVSLEIDYATPDDIANDKSDNIRSLRLTDEELSGDGPKAVAIEDVSTIGTGKSAELLSASVKHNPEPDQPVAALTGIRIVELKDEATGLSFHTRIGLEIELQEYDAATGKLGAKLDNVTSDFDGSTTDLTKHIDEDRQDGALYYTVTQRWDGIAEKFALRAATPSPLAMLCGARLHHHGETRDTAMAVYPVATLDIPSNG